MSEYKHDITEIVVDFSFATHSDPQGLAYSTIEHSRRSTCLRNRTSACNGPPPPHHHDRPQEFGPVRSVRTGNWMSAFAFSTSQTSESRPSTRDRFSPDRSQRGTPEKRSEFFGFLPRSQCDTVTHNPLVPGSSPGGPTISLGNHSVMAPRAGDSGFLV